MKTETKTFDIVVCGGGLAGFCAAVAAARRGRKTCLINNRPVLGGNSSSEIGVTPHSSAAFHAYARETGIISELLIEERARNHSQISENGWTNSVWDLVLYDMAVETENLTLFLNTDIHGVIKRGERMLQAVQARVLNAEVELTIEGRMFLDCTGDGLVADAAGCKWRMGTESREEFGEPHAPLQASGDTMGNSIHFLARDMGRPVPYELPKWAVEYRDASFFYEQGRPPKEESGGYWWIEIGVPYHVIHDNETIRHELTRHALGVWNWMKNLDPKMKERTRNYALDWLGQVPGKRESRRILGRYFMTEHDALNKTRFADEIAFGGWYVDLHTPGGLLSGSSEPQAAEGGLLDPYHTFTEYSAQSYCGPYGIPLRILLAKDIDNLLLAGRNVSVTHAALGTVRVMGTTAIMGQAAGVAASLAVERDHTLDQLVTEDIGEIQQTLLRDGAFLLNLRNEDPADLARQAAATASSDAPIYGVGPESPAFHEGMKIWTDHPQYEIEKIEVRRGELIALDSGVIDELEFCLSNRSGRPQPLEVRLYATEDIWDYRVEPGEALASGTLEVPPGEQVWVRWPVGLRLADWKRCAFVRVDALPNPEVSWHACERLVPGHLAMYQIAPSKMRRFGSGQTLAYRIHPPQRPFDGGQVLSGVTRPHRTTNLWVSDPGQVLPQWVELAWDGPQTIREIQIVFPGHLVREYHAYGPFYRDPQCARDYAIQAWNGEGWGDVLRVTGNYQRLRRHRLEEAVTTSRLRVLITATNGDPSAALYEIRCYGE